MLKSAAMFAVLLVTLASCAKGPEITTLPKDERKPVPASTASGLVPASVPTPKIPTPPVVATKPPVALEPTVVVGRTDTEIKTAFGDPNLRRQDSPAEVWQYLTPVCALHLFFYPGSSGDALVVRYIAINGRSSDNFSDLDRKQCFNDHLQAVGAEEAFVANKAS